MTVNPTNERDDVVSAPRCTHPPCAPQCTHPQCALTECHHPPCPPIPEPPAQD